MTILLGGQFENKATNLTTWSLSYEIWCGPWSVFSFDSLLYFYIFINDYDSIIVVYLLRT